MILSVSPPVCASTNTGKVGIVTNSGRDEYLHNQLPTASPFYLSQAVLVGRFELPRAGLFRVVEEQSPDYNQFDKN